MKRTMYLVIKHVWTEYADAWFYEDVEHALFSKKENAEKYIKETMHKEYKEFSNDDEIYYPELDETYNRISYYDERRASDRFDAWIIKEIEVQDEEV